MAASTDGLQNMSVTANQVQSGGYKLPFTSIDIGYAIVPSLICLVVGIILYNMWCLRPKKGANRG